MSANRADSLRGTRLFYNDARPNNVELTAVQSLALPADWPAVTLISVSSLTITQFLPPEASSEGREMEFWVKSSTTSGTLTLKDLSGNVVVSAAVIGGYAKAVCINGVWRGFKATGG